MTDLPALIELAERAPGPDRAIDHMIAAQIGLSDWLSKETTYERWTELLGKSAQSWVPYFTSSLDAAMTLVPEGCSVHLHLLPYSAAHAEVGIRKTAIAATPALALCAASLRSPSFHGGGGMSWHMFPPLDPWVFVCAGKGSDRGMHHWRRHPEGDATCKNCGVKLDKEQAARCFSGCETPLGLVKHHTSESEHG